MSPSEYDSNPLYFWNFRSSSVFLRWHIVQNVAKWAFLLSFCATKITSFCSGLLPSFLVHYSLRASFSFLVNYCLHIQDFHGVRHWIVRLFVPAMWFSWTDEPPRYMHVLSCCNLVGFTTLRFICLKAGEFLCSSLATTLPHPPTFSSRSRWFLKILPYLSDRWNNASALSSFGFSFVKSCFSLLSCQDNAPSRSRFPACLVNQAAFVEKPMEDLLNTEQQTNFSLQLADVIAHLSLP